MAKGNSRYWIIVASKDHVKNAVDQGIVQSCHGKVSPLKRMHKGDFLIYYSGKQTMGKPQPCQEFTAIGRVVDELIYEVQVTVDFCPSRRNIEFLRSEDVSILPLIAELDFIPNKKSWGYPFRFGFFEIQRNDFERISSRMIQQDV